MRRIFWIVAALFILAVLSPAKGAEYKMTVMNAEGHHSVLGLQFLAKTLAEKTGGKLTAHVYTAGQLATGEREILDGLQFGTIDIGIVSTGILAGLDDRFAMFSLPYVFRDEQNVYNMVDGDLGGEIAEIMEAQTGLKIIGWFMSGVHTMTANKPINKMADLKGMKIRCMENPTITATWRSFGAAPTPMSIGEVFTALQQGTVDGQDNGTANTYSNKYYEVQKYLCMTEHLIAPHVVIMSGERYAAIPDDLKGAFAEAMREATAFQRKTYAEHNAAAIDNMRAKGMDVTFPDKGEFIEASEPVRQEYVAQMGPDMAAWIKDIETKYRQ